MLAKNDSDPPKAFYLRDSASITLSNTQAVRVSEVFRLDKELSQRSLLAKGERIGSSGFLWATFVDIPAAAQNLEIFLTPAEASTGLYTDPYSPIIYHNLQYPQLIDGAGFYQKLLNRKVSVIVAQGNVSTTFIGTLLCAGKSEQTGDVLATKDDTAFVIKLENGALQWIRSTYVISIQAVDSRIEELIPYHRLVNAKLGDIFPIDSLPLAFTLVYNLPPEGALSCKISHRIHVLYSTSAMWLETTCRVSNETDIDLKDTNFSYLEYMEEAKPQGDDPKFNNVRQERSVPRAAMASYHQKGGGGDGGYESSAQLQYEAIEESSSSITSMNKTVRFPTKSYTPGVLSSQKSIVFVLRRVIIDCKLWHYFRWTEPANSFETIPRKTCRILQWDKSEIRKASRYLATETPKSSLDTPLSGNVDVDWMNKSGSDAQPVMRGAYINAWQSGLVYNLNIGMTDKVTVSRIFEGTTRVDASNVSQRVRVEIRNYAPVDLLVKLEELLSTEVPTKKRVSLFVVRNYDVALNPPQGTTEKLYYNKVLSRRMNEDDASEDDQIKTNAWMDYAAYYSVPKHGGEKREQYLAYGKETRSLPARKSDLTTAWNPQANIPSTDPRMVDLRFAVPGAVEVNDVTEPGTVILIYEYFTVEQGQFAAGTALSRALPVGDGMNDIPIKKPSTTSAAAGGGTKKNWIQLGGGFTGREGCNSLDYAII